MSPAWCAGCPPCGTLLGILALGVFSSLRMQHFLLPWEPTCCPFTLECVSHLPLPLLSFAFQPNNHPLLSASLPSLFSLERSHSSVVRSLPWVFHCHSPYPILEIALKCDCVGNVLPHCTASLCIPSP